MSKQLEIGEVRIKAFADLRSYVDPETSYKLECPTVISSIMENLSLPRHKVNIIFVNGHHANPDDMVSAGDVLSFFPAVGGG